MQPLPPRYVVDPADPRAPSQDIWDSLTPQERAQIVASLPSDVPLDVSPPEGDLHRREKVRVTDALERFLKKIGKRVYVSSELATYYPGERVFCPDVLAVLDVESTARNSWVVTQEGKGLDLVLEVHGWSDDHKDYELNVGRYARLGIAEYFLLDVRRERLLGWRLPTGGPRVYQRLLPQSGLLTSAVLGLELGLERGKLRFYFGTAALPDADELISRLDTLVTDLVEKRESEAKARKDAEARVAELEARLAELEKRTQDKPDD